MDKNYVDMTKDEYNEYIKNINTLKEVSDISNIFSNLLIDIYNEINTYSDVSYEMHKKIERYKALLDKLKSKKN